MSTIQPERWLFWPTFSARLQFQQLEPDPIDSNLLTQCHVRQEGDWHEN